MRRDILNWWIILQKKKKKNDIQTFMVDWENEQCEWEGKEGEENEETFAISSLYYYYYIIKIIIMNLWIMLSTVGLLFIVYVYIYICQYMIVCNRPLWPSVNNILMGDIVCTCLYPFSVKV